MTRLAPVMRLAAGEARKAMALAISRGSPRRFSGIFATVAS
jgi:hypothetical protein